MSKKYIYETQNNKLEFNHHNSLLVFMALECVDYEFSYEQYEAYMLQCPLMGKIPKSRYLELINIVCNK